MGKNRQIRLNRELVTLLVLVIIMYFSIQTGNGLEDELNGYTDDLVLKFSGITQNSLEACPWILNLTSHEIIGLNEEFRNYFQNDLKKEIAEYPDFLNSTNIKIEYSDIDLLTEDLPYKYNTSEFDPYGCFVDLELLERNESLIEKYSSTVAPVLESKIASKWYVEHAEFIKRSPISAEASIYPTEILMGIGTLSLIWRKSKKNLK
ncbi:MAG: hypothetical protein ACTSR2_13205 [Candidatus Hodarchaeales archaeon]